jgi:hypothetical protein
MPTRDRKPHTNVRLTTEEDSALQAEAEERGVTRSEVVDEVVRAFLDDEARVAAGLVRIPLQGRSTRLVGFVLTPVARDLLKDAKRRQGFAKMDVVRAALAAIVRRRSGG